MNETDAQSESIHAFDPTRFRLPEDFRANNESKNSEATGVRRYKKQTKVKFYRFDAEVLDKLFAATHCSALAIMMALEELWFTDFDHRNPVSLTSYNLQRFGLTRYRKYHGLETLEKAGLILVDRTNGKNPSVTLTWHPISR